MRDKVAVVAFPGSNCDRDTVRALEAIDADPVWVWHEEPSRLDGIRRVILPGGFSYGDYLRAGALAAHSSAMDAIAEGVAEGLLWVLGICNGFQILCERGLLPGALWANRSGLFRCSWEMVEVVATPPAWPGFRPGDRFRLPIAHGEGAFRVVPAEEESLVAAGELFLAYRDPVGSDSAYNPNGSVRAVAGVQRGRVMGLMPHPERATSQALGSIDGITFLRRWLEGTR